MIITHKINMDLSSNGIAPKIQMVQGDCCSRNIQLRLFSNGAPWHIPKNAMALIRYRRPDHSVGAYDTLPDGSCAYAVSGNTITVSVAPEALAIAGTVSLVVTLVDAEKELSTFAMLLETQQNLTSGPAAEGDYASITGMVKTPDHAEVGQALVVAAVNKDNTPTQWETAPLPKMPEDYVPLDGSKEMTGILKMPRIRICGTSEGNIWPRTIFDHDGRVIGELDVCPDTHQIRLVQKTKDTYTAEVYKLPAPAAGSTGTKQYELLTTRNPVAIYQGGTGATSAADARTALGAAAATHYHNASSISGGTLNVNRLPNIPISKGGTGATNASAARTNLGAAAAEHTHAVLTINNQTYDGSGAVDFTAIINAMIDAKLTDLAAGNTSGVSE